MNHPGETQRRRRIGDRRGAPIAQMPWKQLVNPLPPTKLISDDEVEALHEAALTILETIGIRCQVAEAREIFRNAGAIVDDSIAQVRVGRDIVEAALKTVPSQIVMTPRNRAHEVRIGNEFLTTAAVLGPPNCSDLERGRRSGTLADFTDFLKLTQLFNLVQMNGWPVEPLDIEVKDRHLDAALAMLTYTDKVPYVFCQSRQRILDVFEMCAIARGEKLEEFGKRPGVFSIINTNTPLQYDVPMTIGVMEMARFGQPVLLTPFIIAGASTPATIAGAMAMCNAEVLFGLVLGQLIRSGAPILYGCAAKNVDMKTGAPAYGLVEAYRCKQIGGQMARRYGIPLRSSNFSSSNTTDFASGYESQGSVWSAMTAGTNLLMHAAGWVEGGLCASFEKFVLDIELLQMMAQYLEPVRVDADTIGIDEIAQVGPGGHFFGTERTIATYASAFYQPLISSTQNYGAWREGGGLDAAQRANRIYHQALKEYEQPAIDPAVAEELAAFVARRKAEGGAPIE